LAIATLATEFAHMQLSQDDNVERSTEGKTCHGRQYIRAQL
jgi:hypothetical protein